jgi:hypothetical protein
MGTNRLALRLKHVSDEADSSEIDVQALQPPDVSSSSFLLLRPQWFALFCRPRAWAIRASRHAGLP